MLSLTKKWPLVITVSKLPYGFGPPVPPGFPRASPGILFRFISASSRFIWIQLGETRGKTRVKPGATSCTRFYSSFISVYSVYDRRKSWTFQRKFSESPLGLWKFSLKNLRFSTIIDQVNRDETRVKPGAASCTGFSLVLISVYSKLNPDESRWSWDESEKNTRGSSGESGRNWWP